jgi:hypothetical protein
LKLYDFKHPYSLCLDNIDKRKPIEDNFTQGDKYEPGISFSDIQKQLQELKEIVLSDMPGVLREGLHESIEMAQELIQSHFNLVVFGYPYNVKTEMAACVAVMQELDPVIQDFRHYNLEGINQLQDMRNRVLQNYIRLKEQCLHHLTLG